MQCWHDFWHESVIVDLNFLNKLKQLIYTQKLAQRLFLFNYVSILNSTFILLLRKKTRFPRLKIVVTSQKQLRTIRTDPLVNIKSNLMPGKLMSKENENVRSFIDFKFILLYF